MRWESECSGEKKRGGDATCGGGYCAPGSHATGEVIKGDAKWRSAEARGRRGDGCCLRCGECRLNMATSWRRRGRRCWRGYAGGWDATWRSCVGGRGGWEARTRRGYSRFRTGIWTGEGTDASWNYGMVSWVPKGFWGRMVSRRCEAAVESGGSRHST